MYRSEYSHSAEQHTQHRPVPASVVCPEGGPALPLSAAKLEKDRNVILSFVEAPTSRVDDNVLAFLPTFLGLLWSSLSF